MEEKIDKQTAGREFDRFVDMMDLLVDTSEMEPGDLSDYTRHKTRIVRAIQRGHLVINDSGEAEYTPYNPKTPYKDTITFHERTGADLMATDGKKQGYDVSKTYAAMGAMCKVPPKVFANMVGGDIKVCEALFVLLMD